MSLLACNPNITSFSVISLIHCTIVLAGFRVATNLENLEYSGISLNMEKLREFSRNCVQPHGKIVTNKIFLVRHSFKYFCKTAVDVVRVQWWPVILLELMWNDPWWRSLLHLLFVAINYGKVSLWLWKSLENSGNFFLLLCSHPGFVSESKPSYMFLVVMLWFLLSASCDCFSTITRTSFSNLYFCQGDCFRSGLCVCVQNILKSYEWI